MTDLVERVAQRFAYIENGPSEADYDKAKAAVAIVLREAAKVAFEESAGYPRQDPGMIAAAIRALAETNN